MKTILLSIIITFYATIITIAQQDSTEINDQEVIDWLKQNAVPIKTLNAGKNFNDLLPLKETFNDVKIVGLGEATHGTSEFFKMKHRLVEFLVTELGFTHLVMESPFAGCVAINEYILYGKGDLYSVLSGQAYDAWDMEEFADLIEWMKNYNENVADNKKVRFFGISMGYNDIGRERTLAYLNKVAPEKITMIDSIFQILSKEEEKIFIAYNENVMLSILKPYQDFVRDFIAKKNKMISVSSEDEWNTIFQYLKIMEQSILQAIKSPQTSVTTIQSERNHYLALNLLDRIEMEHPETKFMVWAHNLHICSTSKNRIGGMMKENFGDQYYSISFNCYQGTFQTAVLHSDRSFGPLKTDSISTKNRNMDWYLYSTGYDKMFVDLHPAQQNAEMIKWMETPQKKVHAGWPYSGKGAIKSNEVLKDKCNGILFIQQSTPTHPTSNTLKRRNTSDN